MAVTPSGMPGSPTALLAELRRHAPSRPFVTYYDLASEGRTELSVATFANWVAKTVALLSEEGDVGPGDRVSLVLPTHWLGLVWPMAVWGVGGVVVLEPEPTATLRVRSVDEVDATQATEGLVVVSTLPWGGPAGAGTPPGALDYGREVLRQPDELGPTPDAAPRDRDDPLVRLLEQAAARLPTCAGSRLMVVSERTTARVLRDALLVPLLGDGSTVLVAAAEDEDAERLGQVASVERAVVAGGAESVPPA